MMFIQSWATLEKSAIVIFTKDPEARCRDLVELCTWLNPDLGHFVETTSHFDTVFAARPQANQAG